MLAALHLIDPRPDLLSGLSDADWGAALDFADRSQLTLALRRASCDRMPGWVRERTDRDAAHNLERLRTAEELYRFLADRLAGIPFLALKGLTHTPDFGSAPADRPQYDIDLFTPREHVETARDALLACRYESIEGMERFPTDHIPALIRKTGWEWRGDFFDPEMPLAVELHFQFWSPAMERLRAPGVEEFWDRRIARRIAGADLAVLSAYDALGYAALHLLRHVLRGSARPFHVFEIACFLAARENDAAFWRDWRGLHPPALRRLEAVAFRLAAEWFGCPLGEAAGEVERLPAATEAWFSEFATSPATRVFRPSKDELWLHISLLDSRRDAWSVARRRLLPTSLPRPVDAVHIPERDMQWIRRLIRGTRYAAYLVSRAGYHAAALPLALHGGVRWLWRVRQVNMAAIGRSS